MEALVRLTKPLFELAGDEISGRDPFLIAGGLFLLGKPSLEIHDKLGERGERPARGVGASFTAVIVQIVLLDLVFSIDSVITAIGMANRVVITVLAMVIAGAFPTISSRAVSRFVERHPSVKVLALGFLLLIGVALVGEGLDMHIPRGASTLPWHFPCLPRC